MYLLCTCSFLVFEHIMCSFHTLWIPFLCLLCTLVPSSWSIWIPFSMSSLHTWAFFVVQCLCLLHRPYGFPLFYIFFAHLHLLHGPAHPMLTPHLMDSLSSSSSPCSSSIQCRCIPYTKFSHDITFANAFLFLFTCPLWSACAHSHLL